MTIGFSGRIVTKAPQVPPERRTRDLSVIESVVPVRETAHLLGGGPARSVACMPSAVRRATWKIVTPRRPQGRSYKSVTNHHRGSR